MKRHWLPAMALALAAQPALAADCPPAGSLPGYLADGDTQLRAYQSREFPVTTGDDTAHVPVAGAFCNTVYAVKQGTDPMSDLEIQTNYRTQLKRAGAEIVHQDDRSTAARLIAGGKETWIQVYSQETSIEIHVIAKAPHRQTLLPPSGGDHRLLGRMPGYRADPPEKRNFDKLSFTVQQGDDTAEITASGARTRIDYAVQDPSRPASDLDIHTNYRNAVRAAGGEVVWETERGTTAHFERDGQSIWVKVESQETAISVQVIEEKPFAPSIRPPEAAAMKSALETAGRLTLYVPFDFNKATLKPEAAPVIAQVARLLRESPNLRIAIEGHTDGIGGHDYNVKLSEARAAAVRAAVAAAGIAADRMTATGLGPDKPIADNATEEGRARNRRVELVRS